MKILALDIGAGTTDILLYDDEKTLENCTKLVIPSMSRVQAGRVKEITAQGKDLFVEGFTIGGGSFSRALEQHLAAGWQVYMTELAAYTVRNSLEDVVARGIRITEQPPPDFNGVSLFSDELDLEPLRALLASTGESLDSLSAAAVAVQDHGTYPPGASNRKTRLAHMRAALERDPTPLSLAYYQPEIPPQFPRMRSAALRLGEQLGPEQVLVMDTSPAAIYGCLADPHVESRAAGHILLINAGNGHTMASLLSGGSMVALLEHHTKYIDSPVFPDYLRRFADGEADDADPYLESGHGLFYLGEPPGMDSVELIAVTGPNRGLLAHTGLPVYFPTPGGDMMMTGPMGLVRAVLGRAGQRRADAK